MHSVTEYTMSEIISAVYEKMEETGQQEGILFIDEINCVSETLAPTMLQFLQCKTFGNQQVPEGWIIVAAGNPPEYNKSVREFDIVTLDLSLIHILYINMRYLDVALSSLAWEITTDIPRIGTDGLKNAVKHHMEIHPVHQHGIFPIEICQIMGFVCNF